MKSVREKPGKKTVALLHNIPKWYCHEISALLLCDKLFEVVAAIFRLEALENGRCFTFFLPNTVPIYEHGPCLPETKVCSIVVHQIMAGILRCASPG